VVMGMTEDGGEVQPIDQAIIEYWDWIYRYQQTLVGFYDDGDQSAEGIMLNFMGKWTMTFGPIAGEYGDQWRDALDDWWMWMLDYFYKIDDRDDQLDEPDAKLVIQEVMLAFDDLVLSASGGDADD